MSVLFTSVDITEGKMNKDAIANLLNRKSCRQFTEEQIDSEKLDIILQCGTHAPTGRNAQSALIVAVQDKETRDKLSRLNALGGDNDPFYGAPTVVIVLGLKNGCTPFEDGCLIMGNMLNAAYACGLGGCFIHRARQMFETEEGKELLLKWGITEEVFGIGCLILGNIKGELHPDLERKADYIRIIK